MTIQQISEQCEAEFENIDVVITQLFSIIEEKESRYSPVELAGIATFIHNFYNGIENILKRVLAFKNIKFENTPTWHKDLLILSLKTKIISKNLYEQLLKYLSFRHFFIHSYSFTLRWDDMEPLISNLIKTLEECKIEIYAYIDA